MMRAQVCHQRAPVETRPLSLEQIPEPEPCDGDVLLDVEVCAVCRTDLHVVEGDLEGGKLPIVPGHQIIGRARDTNVRFGAAWLHETCGQCSFCSRGSENLCDRPTFTGFHVDGGYAESVAAKRDFLYEIPEEADAAQVAPLLCAGIIGFRALRRSGVEPGQDLGLYGFGSSAHIVIQIARHWGCAVSVITRGAKHRKLAEDMGADWVGDADDAPPRPLDAAIVFAPSGEAIARALSAVGKAGTVACAGIHSSDLPSLEYSRHLFGEKTLTSVTANTRKDGRELLRLAWEIPIRTSVEEFSLQEANDALLKLKADGIRGSAVLRIK